MNIIGIVIVLVLSCLIFVYIDEIIWFIKKIAPFIPMTLFCGAIIIGWIHFCNWFFDGPVTNFFNGPVTHVVIPAIDKAIIQPAKEDEKLRIAINEFLKKDEDEVNSRINTRCTETLFSWSIKTGLGYATVEICTTDVNYNNRFCRTCELLFVPHHNTFKYKKVLTVK